MPVVMCFGDSNTHGGGPMPALRQGNRFDRATRWPGVMAAALGPDWHLVEEGQPGRTTVQDDPVEGAHRNGSRALLMLLESHGPIDVLVIMLGTNDLKHRFAFGAFDIAEGVGKLVGIARQSGQVGRLVIVSPPLPRSEGALRAMFAGCEAKGAGLPQELARIAAEHGAGFVDAGALISCHPSDGVHFDAAAHAVLGAAITRAVRAAHSGSGD